MTIEPYHFAHISDYYSEFIKRVGVWGVDTNNLSHVCRAYWYLSTGIRADAYDRKRMELFAVSNHG